uniref:Saposin B-type domain-containing protein n=1 Tax=Caenorhabditis tropicalis TaxID=1561998 RepID=A0A1I7T1R8_9PELO
MISIGYIPSGKEIAVLANLDGGFRECSTCESVLYCLNSAAQNNHTDVIALKVLIRAHSGENTVCPDHRTITERDLD